jgi:hypothetical protein
MEMSAELRRRALRGIGIALVAAGVGTRMYEQRMLRMRLRTNAIGRHAELRFDDPGLIASTLGLAALAASKRFTRAG